MKDKLKQIKFIDQKLLPIFNIQSIIDYKSKVSLNNIRQNKNIINDLNDNLDEIKTIFRVKEFNFHKTQNKVKSYTQAFALLKKCLDICNIPYDTIQEGKHNNLRLIEKNILLENYIKYQKMSDIRFSDLKEIVLNNSKTLVYKELLENIKKEESIEFFVPLFKCTKHDKNNQIYIHLDHWQHFTFDNLNKFEIDFISKNDQNGDIINKDYIDKSMFGSGYEIILNTEVIYSNKLKENENLFPNCVLPFSLNNFTTLGFRIYCNIPYDILQNLITLKLKMNRIVFKKKFNLLGGLAIDIPFDGKILRFMDGIITVLPKFEKLTEDMRLIEKLGDDPIDKNGSEIITEKYKCYKMTDKTFKDEGKETNAIKILCCGYDIAFFNLREVLLRSNFYRIENNKYVLKHTISRYCDLIGNIQIHFPDIVNDDITIKLLTSKFPPTIDKVEQINFTFVNEKIIKLQKYDDTKLCSLISHVGGVVLIIEISTNNNNINKIMQETLLSYDCYFLDISLRQVASFNDCLEIK